MDARLRQALARAEEVARELADPETARNPTRLKALGREHARLEQVRLTSAQLERLSDELAQAREVAREPDPATAQLGRDEVERLAPALEPLERQLDELLTPADPLDDRDAIVAKLDADQARHVHLHVLHRGAAPGALAPGAPRTRGHAGARRFETQRRWMEGRTAVHPYERTGGIVSLS